METTAGQQMALQANANVNQSVFGSILFNVKAYGAKGDGVTDDNASIQSAMNAAIAANGVLYFPSGNFISSSKITSSGKNVAIKGAGVNISRIIFTSTVGGFDLTLNSQGVNTPPQQLLVADLAIESRATVANPAINATWTTYQANAQGQAWFENVQITRTNTGLGSFSAGVQLKNCFVSFITHCIFLGDDLRVSAVAVNLIDCVSLRMDNCDINRYATGVKARVVNATQTEGLIIENCFIYDIFTGIDVQKAIHVNVLGTHVNINGANATCDISFDQCNQSIISNCLLYAGGASGDAANQDAIRILPDCSGLIICDNMLVGLSAPNNRYGILMQARGIAPFGTISWCLIQNNSFNFFPTGISIPVATMTSNNITNNLFYSVASPMNDIGTDNYTMDNTAAGLPINGLRWGVATGQFRTGELSTNSSWGGFFKGYSGTSADLAFSDSAGNVAATVRDGSFKVKSYVKTALPLATTAGGIIYVSNDVGGPTLAFSNGTNWLRVRDNAIIS